MNLLTIYDDLDKNRGEYFAASHEDLINRLQYQNIANHQSLNTNKCLEQSIDFYTPAFDGQPFIFIAYTHGSSVSVCVSDEDYVHTKNAYLFNKTLFYACCCLSAQSLGQYLVANGCTVFLGFDARISSCSPETEGVFQDCENVFIEHFLNTECSILECQAKMNEKYGQMISYLSANYSTFEAGILDSNLQAFRLLCNQEAETLTKRHFFSHF